MVQTIGKRKPGGLNEGWVKELSFIIVPLSKEETAPTASGIKIEMMSVSLFLIFIVYSPKNHCKNSMHEIRKLYKGYFCLINYAIIRIGKRFGR